MPFGGEAEGEKCKLYNYLLLLDKQEEKQAGASANNNNSHKTGIVDYCIIYTLIIHSMILNHKSLIIKFSLNQTILK